VLADEYKPNATTKKFAVLEVETEAGGLCAKVGKVNAVTGTVAAEVKNVGNEVEGVFPNPELKGNTLVAFGSAAKLTGTARTKLKAGEGTTLAAV
jgi:hypothetical protein